VIPAPTLCGSCAGMVGRFVSWTVKRRPRRGTPCILWSLMMHAARLSGAAALLSWLLVACGTKSAPAAVPEGSANEDRTEAVAQEGPRARAGTPKIAADQPSHDFGAVKATDSLEHVFQIENVGTADLKIERVQRT
jgi:hypothetical protein